MAASTNRDVKLTVSAETIGENNIRELADQVRALAKTGGDAAPQFEQLARELDRVADNQRAIQTLQDLDAAMAETGRQVAAASEAYETAAARVNEQSEAVDKLQAVQKDANDTLTANKQALIAAREAYALLRADVQSHAERTDADRQALSQSAAAQATATAEVSRARLAYTALKPEVAAASAELDKLEKSAGFASRTLAGAQSVAAAQVASYDAAAAAAAALGLQVDNLVGEQAKLTDSQNAIVASTTKLQTAQVAQAEAQSLLAQQAVALQQATIALERELQAEEQASLKAKAATAADEQAKAEAADGYQLFLRSVEEVNAALFDQAKAQEAAAAVGIAAKLREDAAAALEAAEAYDAFIEAGRELDTMLLSQQQAEAALAEAKLEQAESDRLAIIQINSAFEARARGVTALHAELAAINEVAAADAAAAESQGRIAAALRETAAAAETARVALAGAFSDVGTRSLQMIQAEIASVENAVATLRVNFEAGSISAQDMARGIGGATVALERLRVEAANIPALDGVFKQISSSINAVISDFGALGAAIATVGFAVKPILDANIQLEQTRRILTQVFGSTDEANRQIAALQASADKSGISITQLTTSFTQFAAASRTAGLSTQQVQSIFSATVGAAGQLGLSSEKVTLILEALGQMASKGVVSMEELRRQLGNSLPGALSLMAKSLGITTGELDKLVSTGKLLAVDALPALATAMAKIGDQGKPVEGLQQAIARLGNAIVEFEQKLQNTSAYRVLTDAIGGLAKNFDAAVTSVKLLGEAFAIGKIVSYFNGVQTLNASLKATAVATELTTAATLAATAEETRATVATEANTVARVANAEAINIQTAANVRSAGVFTNITGQIGTASIAAFKGVETAASIGGRAIGALGGAVRGLVGIVGGLPGIAALVALNYKEIGTAIGEYAARLTGAGKTLDEFDKKMAAQLQREQDIRDSANKTGTSTVALQVAYGKVTTELETGIIAQRKYIEATKLTGEAQVIAANITGDLTTKVEARAKADEANSRAAQGLADKQAIVTKATRDYIVQVTEAAKANGTYNDATKKLIEAQSQLLEKQEAGAAEAQAQADQMKLVAVQSDIAAQAARDNSGRVVELEAAYAKAQATVAKYAAIVGKTADETKAATAADLEAAKAKAILNGAYQNQIDNANRVNALAQGQAAVQQAQTNATIASYQAERQRAIAIGDTRTATEAQINTDRAQTDNLRTQITAKNADIAATRVQIEVLTKKLNPLADDYEAQKAAIEQLKQKIQIEQAETQTLQSNSDGIDAQTEALERNSIAQQQNAAAAAQAAKAKSDAENGYHANHPVAVDNTGASSLQQKIQNGTIGIDDIATLKTVIDQLKQNQQANFNARVSNPGLIDNSAIDSVNAQLRDLQAAYDRLAGPQAAGGGSKYQAPTVGPSAAQTPAQAAAAGSTSHTVTVNLGGASTTLSLASANDATAAVTLVQQLVQAATRAQ